MDALADTPLLAGHSRGQERPLGGYATLISLFLALCGAFAAALRISSRELPERIAPADLVMVTLATQKASRMVTKDRVASVVRAPFTRFEGDAGPGEVDEAARGHGLRRAVGELLVCPYCIGMWIASAFTAGLITAPRATRWVATPLTIVFAADLLHIAYKKAEDTL
ncbi:MAG: DUF1360 domain-containing protein [Solirubrobacteraceae bacterium]